MTTRGRTRLPLSRFWVFAAAVLVGSVAYSRAVRRLMLPAELAYVPRETSLILATGEIASLWNGVERHFGSVLGEGDRQGTLASLAETVRTELAARETPIANLSDLTGYGLDVHRGLLVGLNPEVEEPTFVAAVPISDRAAFVAFAAAGNETQPAACLAGVRGGEGAIEAGPIVIAFPEPGLAVVAPSCEPLAETLAARASNLAYAREDDALLDAVRRGLGRPLFSGSGIFAHSRQLLLIPSPAASATAALHLDPDAVRLWGEVRLGESTAQIVRDLLAEPPLEREWRSHLGSEAGAVAVVRDSAAARYLTFASWFSGVDRWMTEWAAGVLIDARDLEELHQLVLVESAYREGLPQVMLGLWATGQELDLFVERVRLRLRNRRDSAVLRGAVRSFRERGGTGDPSPGELMAAGYLDPEPDALFDRYEIFGDEVGPGRLSPEDLETPSYRRRVGAHTIRYLAPAVTSNDLRHRIDATGLSAADREVLLQNRYRLASLRLDELAWVATDERDLVRVIERLAPGGRRTDKDPSFGIAAVDRPHPKLDLFVDVPEIIEQGLLSGDRELEELVEQVLFDFRYHTTLTVGVGTSRTRGALQVAAEGRRAPGDPR